ncbi:FlgJ [Desulforapulum autotrophicum HRM2]|uniref:FlgJ n=1 Tax=Desulforapulum autotrophicum (strain ATCC 43914 / DSM 3382 / VKM B-1955 / HRM2) TaxID=177437 RepID=C0QA38_DESAH|nr:rod-binding protein [Desulforapulum autotrophicum]ACN16756.1 FlgJ [Desulforapulum autotrophicum HRM2]
MDPINSMDLSLSTAKIDRAKANDPTNKDQKELTKACQGFEAIFFSTMVKSMRQTLPGDALFGKSQGVEIFESMYDQALVDRLAGSGRGVGIAEMLEASLDR